MAASRDKDWPSCAHLSNCSFLFFGGQTLGPNLRLFVEGAQVGPKAKPKQVQVRQTQSSTLGQPKTRPKRNGRTLLTGLIPQMGGANQLAGSAKLSLSVQFDCSLSFRHLDAHLAIWTFWLEDHLARATRFGCAHLFGLHRPISVSVCSIVCPKAPQRHPKGALKAPHTTLGSSAGEKLESKAVGRFRSGENKRWKCGVRE